MVIKWRALKTKWKEKVKLRLADESLDFLLSKRASKTARTGMDNHVFWSMEMQSANKSLQLLHLFPVQDLQIWWLINIQHGRMKLYVTEKCKSGIYPETSHTYTISKLSTNWAFQMATFHFLFNCIGSKQYQVKLPHGSATPESLQNCRLAKWNRNRKKFRTYHAIGKCSTIWATHKCYIYNDLA